MDKEEISRKSKEADRIYNTRMAKLNALKKKRIQIIEDLIKKTDQKKILKVQGKIKEL